MLYVSDGRNLCMITNEKLRLSEGKGEKGHIDGSGKGIVSVHGWGQL